jgi:hypothetical protein
MVDERDVRIVTTSTVMELRLQEGPQLKQITRDSIDRPQDGADRPSIKTIADQRDTFALPIL